MENQHSITNIPVIIIGESKSRNLNTYRIKVRASKNIQYR